MPEISPLTNDLMGWTGAGLVILAYVLLSIQWMNGNSFSYQVLNITGGTLLVVNSYYLRAFPSVGVNAIWVVIGLLTLLREWWKGPAEAYKNVSSQFSKRVKLQKITLKHIKLPNFKHVTRVKQKSGQTQAT